MAHDLRYPPLTDALKAAREKKGQSQRAFGSKIGVPQGRLSKIENAAVDLQTSNLLEIARALDLEVMLIPRPLIPAVTSLIRQAEQTEKPEEAPRPVYALDEEADDDG